MPSCMDVILYIHGSASLCEDSLDVVGIPLHVCIVIHNKPPNKAGPCLIVNRSM